MKYFLYFLYFFCMMFIFGSINLNAQDLDEEVVPVEMKFRGYSRDGAIALVISNRAPIFSEVSSITYDFTQDDFRIGVAPAGFEVDLTTLNKKNSPFASDVRFVMVLAIKNQNISEKVIHADVQVLRISDGKIVSREIAAPRAIIKMLSTQMKKVLAELMPKSSVGNITISEQRGNLLGFSQENFVGARRGSEVQIQYSNARNGITESTGIVQNFSNEMIYIKDINKKAQTNDTVVAASVKQNRFSFHLGGFVSSLGQSQPMARADTRTWLSPTKNWAGGVKIEGHYERFIPKNLVSTTIIGINFYRAVDTYIMTGIGYRLFFNGWEFLPYARLGLSYKALLLNGSEGTESSLQGFALGLGLNAGLSFNKRITKDFSIGLDVGVQYFPFTFVSVLTDSSTVTVQWNNGTEFQDNFSGYSVFPYINITASWVF